jgi:hypothetical protein
MYGKWTKYDKERPSYRKDQEILAERNGDWVSVKQKKNLRQKLGF